MRKIPINKTAISFRPAPSTLLFVATNNVQAQEYREASPLTFHPSLQELGTEFIQSGKGSIVATDPATDEVLCIVTSSSTGPSDASAIATAYPFGSVIKPAQALVSLSEGIVKPDTKTARHDGFRDGNIKVKCHPHYSPEALVGALAVFRNTWFLKSYLSMLNDTQKCGSKEKAATTRWEHTISIGLSDLLGIDMAGKKGGLVANMSCLSRRYKNNWDPKTIMWAGMGQGDITATPLQLYNLAATIVDRGCLFTPHIYKSVDWVPLPSRFFTPHQTKVPSYIYAGVIEGVRLTVTKGTAIVPNGTTYPVCGKTETTENVGKGRSISIGFAPINKPRIAISVYTEYGGFGADVVAPIVGSMMKKYLKGKLSPKSQAMARRTGCMNTMDK